MRRVRRSIVKLQVASACLVAVGLASAPTASAELSSNSGASWMVNGTVRAIAQHGDVIWIAGSFTQLRERPVGQSGAVIPVNNLAALDAGTGEPADVHMPDLLGNGPIVYTLSVRNGRLYIGGKFTTVDGTRRANLAAIDAATGSLVTGFRPSVGTVWGMTTDEAKVYAGGTFTTAGGQARQRLAAFSLVDGRLDAAWRPAVDERVRDLSVSPDGGSIYVVGHFRNAAGPDGSWRARNSVVKFSTTDGALSTWTPGCPCASELFGMGVEAAGDRVYVGAGGSDWVAAYNTTDGRKMWHTDTNGSVQDVTLMEDRLVLGGHFRYVAPSPGTKFNCYASPGTCTDRMRMAAVDLAGRLSSWNPRMSGPYVGVWSVFDDSRGQLWAGGVFTGVSGTRQEKIARFGAAAFG